MKHRETTSELVLSFRIWFQALGSLSNSTLSEVCPDMRQITTVVIPRISLQQKHRCAHRRVIKLKWIIRQRADCKFSDTFVNLRLNVNVSLNRMCGQRE